MAGAAAGIIHDGGGDSDATLPVIIAGGWEKAEDVYMCISVGVYVHLYLCIYACVFVCLSVYICVHVVYISFFISVSTFVS